MAAFSGFFPLRARVRYLIPPVGMMTNSLLTFDT